MKKYSSFEVLRKLYERMNQILEESMQRKDIMMGTTPDMQASTWDPPIDLYEDDEHYFACMELAGARREAITVEIKNTELRISGVRDIESLFKGGEYHRIEIPRGAFERVIVLPEDIDSDNITAHFNKGLLIVTIPRIEKPTQTNRVIPILDEGENGE